MTKRKSQATSNKKGGKEERAAKHPRAGDDAAASSAGSSSSTAAAAAASTSMPSSLSRSPTASDIDNARLAPLRASNTLKLIDALTLSMASVNGSQLLERVQTVCKLLEDVTHGDDCKLDMSMRADEEDIKSKPALFLLLNLIWKCLPYCPNLIAGQRAALEMLGRCIPPLFPTLLRTFGPAVTDAEKSNNALHEMLSCIAPSKNCWLLELIQQMLERGVNVHARNRAGQTPLLAFVVGLDSSSDGPLSSLLLLHKYGADINAQDSNGNTMLHHLILNEDFHTLQALFESGAVSELDYAILNKDQHTALDLAAVTHAQGQSKAASQVLRLIRVQVQTWRQKIRPVVLQSLTEPLIPELAELTMNYIDGSGKPFTTDEAEVKQPVRQPLEAN